MWILINRYRRIKSKYRVKQKKTSIYYIMRQEYTTLKFRDAFLKY